MTLQVGKGRENWGAGSNIELALSEESNSYDYLMLASNYGNIRVNYLHGVLETTDKNINRYINSRGIEWTNKKFLIVGFSETIIYSGYNRSLDIGYLNPIASHLEIELNNRLNVFGSRSSNAIWQLHLDWLIKNNIRFSYNYLLDEFVLDPETQKNKEHGNALSTKLLYTPLKNTNHIVSLYISFIRVGTSTFRHGVGTNNFVNKGKPLGWDRGSDGEELNFGINYYNKKICLVQ